MKTITFDLELPVFEKVMSLLKLRKLLLEEKYEQCAYWIQTAKNYGAASWEINAILEHPSDSLE